MTFYSEMAAFADAMLVEFGFDATIADRPSATDPVTGAASPGGLPRTVRAFQTKMDFTSFPETMVQKGDRMFIFGGQVDRGERLIDGGEWEIREVKHLKPDNATHIITKALVSG